MEVGIRQDHAQKVPHQEKVRVSKECDDAQVPCKVDLYLSEYSSAYQQGIASWTGQVD